MPKTNTTDHQTLMNQVYDRWQNGDLKDFPRQDFLDACMPQQRAAVLIGNLNYQWGNGGISQWHGNRYSENLNDVRNVLRRMVKHRIVIAADVLGLLDKGMEILTNLDDKDDGDESNGLDEIDTAYYAISEQFMSDFQKYLNNKGY